MEMRERSTTVSRLIPREEQQAIQSPFAISAMQTKVQDGDHVADANVQFADKQPEVGFGGQGGARGAAKPQSTGGNNEDEEEDEEMADVNLTERSQDGPQAQTKNSQHP